MSYPIEQKLIDSIKKDGFRVFIAKSGTYGFYTDLQGSRVISFQDDLGDINFSGNYKTDEPRQTGNGWRITPLINYKGFKSIFNTYPPHWAIGIAKWEFTTLEQHLNKYQKSSQYTEV